MYICNVKPTHLFLKKKKAYQYLLQDWFNKRLKINGLGPGMRLSPINYMKQDAEKDKKFVEELKKYEDANVIVAALIATVTFTAGFTVPGGFVSEKGPLQGTPILGRNSAFQTFMVMDTLALVLSTSSVLIHLFIKIHAYFPFIMWSVLISFYLSISAMLTMVVAFATGTYAMLGHSTAFSILICVLALSFFILFLYFTVWYSHGWIALSKRRKFLNWQVV